MFSGLQRLSLLPREARDTLFLLGVIAWVIAPHAQHLPVWCSLMAAAVLLWRGYLAWHSRPLPASHWKLLLLALALGGTWWSHQTIAGRDAGVTLAVVLLSMKTLELRARRDAFVVFFFGFFIIITHFLFSQNLGLALAMLLGLWGLLAAVVNAHLPSGRPPLSLSFKTSAGLMLLGAPLMVALFFLFPRFAPLWGLPNDQGMGKTGLSGQMEVGEVAELALDERVAFRLRFDGAAPDKSTMYFRGPVLGDFDGKRWEVSSHYGPRPAANSLQAGIRASGPVYHYRITLEPSYRPWLMALEAATAIEDLSDQPFWQNPDLQLMLRRPVSDLLRYRASSQVQYQYDLDLPEWQQRSLQRLPTNSNPRTQAWAQDWRARTVAAQPDIKPNNLALAFSQFLLNKLHQEDYHYTLQPGPYGEHSADEFWFDKQQGFCEHIASSYVIAMRALGVPARIVTGFQGAELNTLDGYWEVRNSDAHAWAEIWLAGQGWQRVDPTGAIAPWRIAIDQTRLKQERGVFGNAIENNIPPTLMLKLRNIWNASNNAWNQWVLNYSQTRQLDALKKIGFDSPNWQDLLRLLGGLLLLIALFGVVFNYWQRRHTDPWLTLLAQARHRLSAWGVSSSSHSSPRQLAGHGQLPTVWQEWLLDLEAWRYAPEAGPALGNLRQRLKRLPRKPKP